MRPRRLAPAAVLLAALVLALAACTGGAPPPAATPTAIATPETPPPAPAPAPEQACANGVAVEEPEERPGLVADCAALLASRDALRGEAALDWSADLAIEGWEGVAVEGEPPRVTGLDLSGKGLTGAIPRTLGGLTELTDLRLAGNRLTGAIPEWLGEVWTLSALILADNALTGGISRSIGRLRLDEVRLAGNALTGCVPSAFGDARGDAAYLGLPWCLRYDRLDATGEVAEAGGWAILGADGEVLATWEGLRSEAATLRVHQTDAGGTSWAAEFGAVSEGGLFEWRKASDCWVRYRVTGPPVRPVAGSGRWEFPVEWMAYAATGEGCTGVVASATVLRVDEEPPVIASRDSGSRIVTVIATPIRFGGYLLIPKDWKGDLEPWTSVEHSSATGQSESLPAWPSENIAEVRQHPLWRDPQLPVGWTLNGVRAHGDFSVTGWYGDEERSIAITVIKHFDTYRQQTPGNSESNIWEARLIDGHPSVVWYHPQKDSSGLNSVKISDEEAGAIYFVLSYAGNSIDTTIGIARSLYRKHTE